MVSGSLDRKCAVVDANGAVVWKTKLQKDGISQVISIDENTFASGTDEGNIKVWDIRSPPKASIDLTEHEDFVSGFDVSADGRHLVATSGEKLGVYDIRKRGGELEALSDALEEDLLCVSILKNGRKVLCGTQSGTINMFSWGDFGDMNDRIVCNSQSVECMVKLNESVVCTGAQDGLIRVVSILPNKILGVLGEHGHTKEAIECLDLSHQHGVIVSSSHDCAARWYSLKNAVDMSTIGVSCATNLLSERFFSDL